ncbi:hypothetical protein LC613_35940 [Nostoc sphaeroides CHAB 2801]|uniref:hypothetical protein n=1 Tax=Nostoc sphaeroides TaxID=446679 RepID=UPI001E597155|nr:hypothetical protein [Nostoc sphaeroides]MCC5632929.1 hypothetical protein [Nostoc sphaeroides CHAB 2801]
MTHVRYTQQALSRYTLPRLKRIAAELGVTPTGDKRATQTWVNAIITHQSTQTHKVTNNQALAQAELDHFIADQAQAVAPEPLRIVEISFGDHEYYADDKLVASISHDDDHLTQRWVVIVNSKEVFRANTVMRCHRYISIHYKDGTLPVQEEEAGAQGAGGKGEEISPLHPAPCSLSSSTTGNEVMAQIFNECEKYGFEILDDGIYQNDQKLGEVGCTDLGWWFTRAADETQQRIPCDSALDAVWWLSMVDTVPHAEAANCEELLDRPFEILTNEEWGQLRDYAPVAESRELVTA